MARPGRRMMSAGARSALEQCHLIWCCNRTQHSIRSKNHATVWELACSLPMMAGQERYSCTGLASPSIVATVVATQAVPYTFVMGGKLAYHACGDPPNPWCTFAIKMYSKQCVSRVQARYWPS